MAADPSYDSFIAQLERKHQTEAPGHNSYFDVFNEASRYVSQLKKGLNFSIRRERLSEVRVAAQTWQDSCYNDRTGAGVDILDWQPRYGRVDTSQGGTAEADGAAVHRAIKSAAAASPSAPSFSQRQRRSNTSPLLRRPGHAAAAAAGGGSSSPATAPLSAVDRVASEPFTPSYRSNQQQLQHGAGGAAGPPGEVMARVCPGLPGRGYRGRRLTDSLLQQATRRGASAATAKDGGRVKAAGVVRQRLPPQQQKQEQQQQGFMGEGVHVSGDDGEGEEQNVVVAVQETSVLGSPGQAPQHQRLLPPLDEPSGPPLCSPTASVAGGSRVDEAIRVFARTAYEPGEHRHSLLLEAGSGGATAGGGTGDCDGSDPHHLEPLPLAPLPRALPKHFTEALSTLLLPNGIRGSVTWHEGAGGRVSREPSSSLGCAGPEGLGGHGPGAVGGGRQVSASLPPAYLHPQPPEEPLNGPYPRPQGHRVRPSAISATGTAGGLSAAAAVAAGGHGSGGGQGSPPPPLRSGRATGRLSAAGPWDSDPVNSPAPPARVRAAAAASITSVGPTAAALLPACGGSVATAAAAHLQAGVRTARESCSGSSPASSTGQGAGGGAAGPDAAALIKGYATVGGGPLDYRTLDAVPRLGIDAPRVRAAAAAAGGGSGGGASGAAAPAVGSHVEIRRGLQGAPAGLANVLHHPRPVTAQTSTGGGSDQLSPVGGRFTRARRASCTGVPSSSAAPSPSAVAAGHSSGSISLGPMLVTREQVDSYVSAQAQVAAKAQAAQAQPGQGQGASDGRGRPAAGSARPGGTHNVIGTRGCLSDEKGPQGPRTLRREVATLEASKARGA